MFLRHTAMMATFLSLLVGAAKAQDNVVVVELFTSQGCSSCPPADAFLAELAQRDDVVALSLHVDYWDYLGWSDQFASPEMTERQRQYAAQLNARSIFTPQMIVQGQTSEVGHQRERVLDAIAHAAAVPPVARIELHEEVGRLLVTITPLQPNLSGVVHIVNYDLPQSLQITKGENSGQMLTYVNVVTGWMQLGLWDGELTELIAPVPTMGKGVAVFVQDGNVGQILAAARIER